MLIDAIYDLVGGSDPVSVLQSVVFALVAIVVALTLHEFAHAAVASLCGDKTSKAQGRLSLNPLNHIDPVGFLMLFVFGFGWAKPVNIRPARFRHPRLGCVLTAAAGPLCNLLQAFIFAFPAYLLSVEAQIKDSAVAGNFAMLFTYLFSINVSLFIFNLIPVPPLDGSKIIGELLPFKAQRAYYSIERYGFFIIIAVSVLLNRLGFYEYIMYTYKFEVFEGPLDLLLSLIEKHKIDIYDIKISLLLEQYMLYIKEAKERNWDLTADFIEMAARLMYIKSYSLLPPKEGDEEEEDPKLDLERMLRAYAKYKQLSEQMREDYIGNKIFFRDVRQEGLPKPPQDDDKIFRKNAFIAQFSGAYRNKGSLGRLTHSLCGGAVERRQAGHVPFPVHVLQKPFGDSGNVFGGA